MRIPKCYFCDEYGVSMIRGKSKDGGDTISIIPVCKNHLPKSVKLEKEE